MRRSPMPPRVVPMPRAHLATVTPLHGRQPLARVTPLRPRSAKQEARYRERRAMLTVLFPDRPQCAVPHCGRWADDAHEPLTRARGGAITDPANIQPLCRPHHDEITFTEPAWAYELGLLRHSWDDGGDVA